MTSDATLYCCPFCRADVMRWMGRGEIMFVCGTFGPQKFGEWGYVISRECCEKLATKGAKHAE